MILSAWISVFAEGLGRSSAIVKMDVAAFVCKIVSFLKLPHYTGTICARTHHHGSSL